MRRHALLCCPLCAESERRRSGRTLVHGKKRQRMEQVGSSISLPASSQCPLCQTCPPSPGLGAAARPSTAQSSTWLSIAVSPTSLDCCLGMGRHSQCVSVERRRATPARVPLRPSSLTPAFFPSVSPSTTQPAVHAALGNADRLDSPWCESEAEAGAALARLEAEGGGSPAPTSSSIPSPPPLHRVRRATATSSAGGLRFRTDECQVVKLASARAFTLEATVATGATYGDRFRCVLRHSLAAGAPPALDAGSRSPSPPPVSSSSTCTWTVEAAIVWVSGPPPPSLARRAVEKGVASGLRAGYSAAAAALASERGLVVRPVVRQRAGVEAGAAPSQPPPPSLFPRLVLFASTAPASAWGGAALGPR